MSVPALRLRMPDVTPHQGVRVRADVIVEHEIDSNESKGDRFIAASPRSGSCIPTVTARSQAPEQGMSQMTLGAGAMQKARCVRSRSLIRRMQSVGERASGQGGDPPVVPKHVRQTLLAVHATLARALVGGAAGDVGRAHACAGMAEMRSY